METLRAAVERCRAGGVGIAAWSFCVADSRRMSLGVKDGQAGNAHHPPHIADSCGAGYRLVWEDGLVSRGRLERAQLESRTDEALQVARSAAYEDPDAAWVLGPAEFPEVEMHDAATARAAGGRVGAIAARLAWIRGRIGELGFRTWSGSFSAVETKTNVFTSAGLEARSLSSSCAWHVSVNGEIGNGFSARKPETEQAFRDRLERLFETARRLEREAEPMKGGPHPVLLHPRVVEAYVLETLLHNLAGPTVFHGEGRFRREQFGAPEPALREDLTLRLDPLCPMKSGSYRFTTDGLPASRCTFIEKGRLARPLLDLKYSRRLGLPPTPPPLAMDTLFLEGPAPLELEQALERAGGGALVLSVMGIHTQDSGSGDFSLAAPQVLRIDGGRLRGRLRATISGNLFDLLADPGLELVRFEGEHTPGLLVSCRLDPK